MKQYNIAIVGATGAVGEAMLQILEERRFPVNKIFPLASARSVGKTVTFKNHQLDVLDLATFDFSEVDIAFFSAGSEISKVYAPIAAKSAIVIDNSSCFRYDADIPLVVPEVNPECIAQYVNKGIIANPNCSTIGIVVAIKPIFDAAGIDRINVATYQAVSGAGKKAISELVRQTGDLLNGKPAGNEVFPAQIAFNLFPHIDTFQDNGYTKEEMKMVWETQKILGDDSIKVNPTAVRVPVFFGHSAAVHLETKQPLSLDDTKGLLAGAPGVVLMGDNQYPTPVKQATGNDDVYVGRLRKDISHENGLDMWIVSDNIRKGAALNAIQIAEVGIREYFK